MTSWPQPEYFAGLVGGSVMARTLEGTINFWNRSAETLYGWKEEEAIGRVSHKLLQTQFSKPLEEIEAELVRNGCWEGKLVHTTRDGRRIVVESRWTLELNENSKTVVEINTRGGDAETAAAAGSDKDRQEAGSRAEVGNQSEKSDGLLPKPVKIVIAGIALLLLMAVLYVLFGHDLIKAIYDERFPWLTRWLMAGRATTPLENYYEDMDSIVLLWILRLVLFVPLAAIFIKKPAGAFVALCSVVVCSFVLFSIVEAFPFLGRSFQSLPFYSIRQSWIADDALSYRGKPFAHFIERGFKGALYSPAYGIEVTPLNGEAILDQNGFKNSYVPSSPDIIVLGDSYVEDGINEADTFPHQLEKNLSGLTVLNLAKAGYGPHQYVEVLKRYGIPKKPKFALLGFFGGNDLENVVGYLRWKNGSTSEDYARIHDILSAQGLAKKYAIAVPESIDYIKKRIWAQLWAYAQLILNRSGSVHPDVAVLKLGNETHKVLLPIDRSSSRTTEEILRSEEFAVLSRLFAEFKDLCIKNNITPAILYFPTAVQIYAEYATQESGSRWLYSRARQIATKEDLERAVRLLCEKLQIEFISVSPAMKRAAEEGKLLYYPTDTHWNQEGKKVAARLVADVLESKFLTK